MRKDEGMITKAEMAEEQKILDNIRKEIFGVFASKPNKTKQKRKSPKNNAVQRVYTPPQTKFRWLSSIRLSVANKRGLKRVKKMDVSLCGICSVELKNCPYFLNSTYNNPHFIPGQEHEVVSASDGKNHQYDLYVTKKCPLFVVEEGLIVEQPEEKLKRKQEELRKRLKQREERRRQAEEQKRQRAERRKQKEERNLQIYYLQLGGMSAKEIAGRFGISKTTVFYVLKKQKDGVLGNAGIREG